MKNKTWALVLALAICIVYMFCDSVGVPLPPVVTILLFIVAACLMTAYIIANYKGKER